MKIKMQLLVEYLQELYDSFVELCGEDDTFNTLPCKKALDTAKEILNAM